MLDKADCICILAAGYTPSNDEVQNEYNLDHSRNPHNNYNKPRKRDKIEIIADLKVKAAKLMYEKIVKEIE